MTGLLLNLILWAITLSSCNVVNIKYPNTTACTAAGHITDGADCGTTNTGVHSYLTGDEYINFLDASPTKPAAICQSADDFGKVITAAEEMCTALKSSCTAEIKTQIRNSKMMLEGRWHELRPLGVE